MCGGPFRLWLHFVALPVCWVQHVQGARGPKEAAYPSISALFHHCFSRAPPGVSLTMWTYGCVQDSSLQRFCISARAYLPPPLAPSLAPVPCRRLQWRIEAPSSDAVPRFGQAETWIDGSRRKLCGPFVTPVAILSLYSALFETCVWGVTLTTGVVPKS
jgi:hypothetical protein